MKFSEEFVLKFNRIFRTFESAYLLNERPDMIGKIVYDNLIVSLVTKEELSKIKDLDSSHYLFKELESKIRFQAEALDLYKMWQNEMERINKVGSKKQK